MSRYAKDAPQVYHDEDALTVCLEALRIVERNLPGMLALPGAERVLMDDHHETCVRDDVDEMRARVFRARALCRIEIERLEAAEVLA